MTKSTKQLIFTLCLLPILFLVIWTNLKQRRATNRGTTEPAAATPEASGGEEVTGEDVESALDSVPEEDLNKQRKRLIMEWGRDPFFGVWGQEGEEQGPVGYSEEETKEPSELSLTAISWMPENPIALINKQLVSEGEFVLGYEVVEIQRDKVILRKGNEEHVLTPEE